MSECLVERWRVEFFPKLTHRGYGHAFAQAAAFARVAPRSTGGRPAWRPLSITYSSRAVLPGSSPQSNLTDPDPLHRSEPVVQGRRKYLNAAVTSQRTSSARRVGD